MPNYQGFEDDWNNLPDKRQYNKTSVPDGEYEAEIESADMRDTKGGDVFTFRLIILSDGPLDGKKLEKSLFMETTKGDEEKRAEYAKKRRGELKIDLATIGFDVKSWKKPGEMIPLACSIMRGCRMKVKVKNSKGDDGTPYCNVYLNKRMSEVDGKPEKFGVAEMKELAEHDFGDSGLGDSPDEPDPTPTQAAKPW